MAWCAGADIRSVCIEAGMFAIRARRKTVTEKDMIDAVNKARAAWPIGAHSTLSKRTHAVHGLNSGVDRLATA
eukprot:6209463-Pleurochrysis_carterae.AAC.1